MEMIGLNFFHKLVQEGPFNVFVGAGISKPAPTCAPLWKEMFRDLAGSMFKRMEREDWPAASAFATDKPQLLSFDFRPETFWELVAAQASLDIVWRTLKVVNSGAPNLNHRLLSLLTSKGIIRNIITTNFDEHIDSCLSGAVRPLITQSQIQQAAVEANKNRDLKSYYFKVHGTVSMPETLQFTLAHTRQLPADKAKCLEACLAGFPLLIAGYSGNDNDVQPCLFDIIQRVVPRVVLVVHPESRSDQPIRKLTNIGSNINLEGANISSVFTQWVKDMAPQDPVIAALLNEPQTVTAFPKNNYTNAIETCPVALIPFIISHLFSFSGNYNAALRYAHLCEDACEDSRYANDLPKGLLRRAFLQVSQCYGLIGQADMSRMFATYAMNAGMGIGFIAGGIENSLSRGLDLLFNNELKEAEFWILGAYSMTKLELGFGFGATRQMFVSCWYLGRLRKRQGRLAEAIAAYQEAGIPKDNILSQPEVGAFLLDYGSALMAYGAETRDGEAFENAGQLFTYAEAVARDAGDQVIRIKALMNLAQGNYMGGAVDIARRQIQEAQECATKIGDSRLRDRVAQLKTIICGK